MQVRLAATKSWTFTDLHPEWPKNTELLVTNHLEGSSYPHDCWECQQSSLQLPYCEVDLTYPHCSFWQPSLWPWALSTGVTGMAVDGFHPPGMAFNDTHFPPLLEGKWGIKRAQNMTEVNEHKVGLWAALMGPSLLGLKYYQHLYGLTFPSYIRTHMSVIITFIFFILLSNKQAVRNGLERT